MERESKSGETKKPYVEIRYLGTNETSFFAVIRLPDGTTVGRHIDNLLKTGLGDEAMIPTGRKIRADNGATVSFYRLQGMEGAYAIDIEFITKAPKPADGIFIGPALIPQIRRLVIGKDGTLLQILSASIPTRKHYHFTTPADIPSMIRFLDRVMREEEGTNFNSKQDQDPTPDEGIYIDRIEVKRARNVSSNEAIKLNNLAMVELLGNKKALWGLRLFFLALLRKRIGERSGQASKQ